MRRVAINTLGCKANQLESSIIADDFARLGWEVVKFGEIADVYIINTCTVTGKSDTNSRYHIRQAKRLNPAAKIVVTGCYAQVGSEELAQMNEVDLIIGNTEKQNVAQIVVNAASSKKIIVSDIMLEDEFKDKAVISASGRVRANIKIQDGCNSRCSYCIIPYARGKSRSNSLKNVISQVKEITDHGFQEIILTGIHLGQWGRDFSPKSNISALLKEIEKVEGLKRFRISSVDPLEFDDELIDTLINSKKFCRHLHISLQSADNEILKAMRRPYTVEYYSELIKRLKKSIPDLAIGSDIIVGFPGETDEHFLNTYNNLKSLPISYIHVFSYSKRKGTPAATMKDQVQEIVKKERNTKLSELAREKNLEFRQSQLGKFNEVMVERTRDRKSGKLKGMTDNYIPVLIEGNDNLKNTLVRVQIVDIQDDCTLGKL